MDLLSSGSRVHQGSWPWAVPGAGLSPLLQLAVRLACVADLGDAKSQLTSASLTWHQRSVQALWLSCQKELPTWPRHLSWRSALA